MAPWSSGQDASLSRWNQGFDSPRSHLESLGNKAFFVLKEVVCNETAEALYGKPKIWYNMMESKKNERNIQMKAGQTGSEKREGYIYGIDGLRAVAVLMVFAYHLRLPFAKGGLLGVTVFFCYIRISDYKDFDHGTGKYPYD